MGKLVISKGYQEDGWLSSAYVFEQLTGAIEKHMVDLPSHSEVLLHNPNCDRDEPRWFDRRVIYPRSIPGGDILHLTDQSYGDALIRANRHFKKMIITVHDVEFWRRRTTANSLFRRRIVAGLKKAHQVVAVSKFTASELEQHLGIRADKVIYNGAATQDFAHCSAPRQEGLIVHVGSTCRRKGIERAFRMLSQLPPHFHLLQVGGTFSPEQLQLMHHLGLSSRVQQIGKVNLEGLVQIYQSAALYLGSSLYEGFCLPPLEARLCGTPALISEEVPVKEILEKDPGTLVLDLTSFDGTSRAKQQDRINQIQNWLPAPTPLSNRQSFSWQRAAKEYYKIYTGGEGSTI